MLVADKSKIVVIAVCCLAVSACESGDSRTKQSADAQEPPGNLAPDLLASPWQTFKTAIEAFHDFDDSAALKYAQELENRYPDQIDEHGQGTHLLRDLRRRKIQGVMRNAPRSLPTGFAEWSSARKVAHLIEELQDISNQYDDERLNALRQLDDAAVPALIDCIESDDRLSRCVYAWREFVPDRFIFPVRRLALSSLEDILGQTFLGPAGTEYERFNEGDPNKLKEVVQKLRDHHRRYGGQQLPERMMAILAAADSTSRELRKAARTLVEHGWKIDGWPIINQSGLSVPPFRSAAHPSLEQFDSPTMAEAILKAMDREFDYYDQDIDDRFYELHRGEVAYDYSVNLILLNDRRIAASLKNRIDATTYFLLKVQFAYACFRLGDKSPVEAIAHGLEQGQLDMPAKQDPSANDADHPRNEALRDVIWMMSVVRTESCKNALKALASPTHAYHRWVLERLDSSDSRDVYVFQSHPFADEFDKDHGE